MIRLVSWLLNFLYLSLLVVSAPWILWTALRTGKYREGLREKLFGLVPLREGRRPCAWIHAVSVGEVNLLAPVVRQLREAHPDWEIVISTTSKTGYELAKKKYAELAVFYCPLDFSWAVRRAMRRVRPSALLLAELELWPNLIWGAKSHGASVAIINGRLSDKSFPGYRRIRPFVARILEQVDLIAAQNEETAERFCVLGAPSVRVHVTGSLKYDGAQVDRANLRTVALRKLASMSEDEIVFLAGSTQEPEEAIAIEIYRKFAGEHPRLRLILVPRHPERFEAVARLLAESGLPWERRSRLASNRHRPAAPRMHPDTDPQPGEMKPVLLVDTIGELGAWWGTTTIAFVGGSFGSRGGQNMVEPAAYGAAVSFGPNTRNFRDIVAALLRVEGAVVVQNEGELEAFVRRCLEEPSFAATLGNQARAMVQSQLGATRRTIILLERMLAMSADSEPSTSDRPAA